MFPNSIEVFKLDFTFNIIKTLEYLVLNRDVSEFVFKFILIHFHVAVIYSHFQSNPVFQMLDVNVNVG